MTVKYKTVITRAGAIKLAAATVPNGKKVNFTAMAIGDGGGKLPTPDVSQTKLINEVWRHTLNKISQDSKNKNYVVAELLIPPETGGFWMREMGLYDDTGTLIAVGNMAESYKPELAEGSGRAQTLRMVIMVSDIESVELTIDTTLVMATQDYVDDKLAKHEQSRRHPDATLKEKGFTQLSSATDSTSESLAATPKAVKVAYDLADGKYTAQDATTKQKGIVQLSSATDSTSEMLAATPKAVKAVSDELTRVKESLGTAAGQNVTTSRADVTPGHLMQVGDYGLGVANGSGETLKSIFDLKCSGKFKAYGAAYQSPTEGMPANSGNTFFGVDATNIYAGQYWVELISINQLYVGMVNLSNKTVSWVQYYSPQFKPTPADIGALALSGGTLTGPVTLNQGLTSKGRIAWGDYANAVGSTTYNAMVNVYDANGKMRWAFGPYQNGWSIYNYDAAGAYVGSLLNIDYTSKKASFAGVVSTGGEFQTTSANSYRMVYGNYGAFWRQDGTNYYLMLTDSGDAYGAYNSLRPFAVNLASGAVTIGKLGLVDYGNFDARYYTKAQSDAKYALLARAYTRAESDARYQPKGSFAAPNTASKGVNGWWQCGSTGIIEQWCQGATMTSETTQAITFPKAFPNACLRVTVSTVNVNKNTGTEGMFQSISQTNTGCMVMANRAYGSIGQVAVVVRAVGY